MSDCTTCGKVSPIQIIKGVINLITGSNEQVAKDRLSICTRCPRKMLKRNKFCRACKCYMPSKVTVLEAECCIGFWGPVTITP